jgi:hypothetical protein
MQVGFVVAKHKEIASEQRVILIAKAFAAVASGKSSPRLDANLICHEPNRTISQR